MPLNQLEEAITKVVEDVGPSVVTISTVQVARDQFLRTFPIEGIGSGVILAEDGLIVTNHHVVRNARRAEVTLQDGRRFEADYVAGNPESDLALLRIPAKGLRAAPMGDSGALRVGQLAIAIGSPFGQVLNGPTVTVGVVSALHRNLAGPGAVIEDLLQTDAPINPGNSGGALLDSQGRIIGINTAIIPQAQGIGFAIPIHRVQALLQDAKADPNRDRPWLGIGGITLSPFVAKQNDIADERGVAVFSIEPGSPAASAGLRERDVIVGLEGQMLHSVEQLKSKIASKRPGDGVQLDLRREGRLRKLLVPLASRPA